MSQHLITMQRIKSISSIECGIAYVSFRDWNQRLRGGLLGITGLSALRVALVKAA